MKYDVIILEGTSWRASVEADSQEEAERKAEALYDEHFSEDSEYLMEKVEDQTYEIICVEGAGSLPPAKPRRYAGPYGHDYFIWRGVLMAQPGNADDSFTPCEDEMIAVTDFVEPLTPGEMDEVATALDLKCPGCNVIRGVGDKCQC